MLSPLHRCTPSSISLALHDMMVSNNLLDCALVRNFLPCWCTDSPNVLCTQAGQALTYDEIQGLTYLQVKGSGIANTCPVLEQGSSNLKDLKPGSYKIEKLCLEPTSFTVKEESQFKDREPEFVKTKLMTRLTYTLDEVNRCPPSS